MKPSGLTQNENKTRQGGVPMFKQLFASMNEALDQIIAQYPLAGPSKREDLEDQLTVLKAMSDTCIEEWLLFEEKMGQLTNPAKEDQPPEYLKAAPQPAAKAPEKVQQHADSGSFARGQGYYKLAMFPEAVFELEKVVDKQPDFLMARIYLAMAYLRTGEFGDAYRHFQFVVPLTEDRRIKAISYNAMGCIHAENNNMDQAMEYFKKAHSADPDSVEPVLNIKNWTNRT